MVEQPRLLLDKHNPALLGCVVDRLIIDRAAGSRDVLRAGLVCTEDVVDERELGPSDPNRFSSEVF